jgi:hypothetical protein
MMEQQFGTATSVRDHPSNARYIAPRVDMGGNHNADPVSGATAAR